jgi:Rod binding domain-containing protein
MLPVAALAPVIPAALGAAGDFHAKAREAAKEFEAMFLNTMLQPMFSTIKSDGPFGGGHAAEVWRSLLTDEYAKGFASAGGIGIADHVYRALIAAQEGGSAQGIKR